MASRKAFTLVELLIVIIIIGLLAAIAAPRLMMVKDKGYYATQNEDVHIFVTAMEVMRDSTGSYPTFGWTSTSGPVAATDSALRVSLPNYSTSPSDSLFVDSVSASGFAAHTVNKFLGRGAGRSRCIRYGRPYNVLSSDLDGKGVSYGCSSNTSDQTVTGSEP